MKKEVGLFIISFFMCFIGYSQINSKDYTYTSFDGYIIEYSERPGDFLEENKYELFTHEEYLDLVKYDGKDIHLQIDVVTQTIVSCNITDPMVSDELQKKIGVLIIGSIEIQSVRNTSHLNKKLIERFIGVDFEYNKKVRKKFEKAASIASKDK